jgi:hypothetical protein
MSARCYSWPACMHQPPAACAMPRCPSLDLHVLALAPALALTLVLMRALLPASLCASVSTLTSRYMGGRRVIRAVIPSIDTAAAAFYSSHFAASRRVRTLRRRNRLDTASLPPAPPTKMCVACTHDSHLQSILIPRSPDPTTAATGHRGTRVALVVGAAVRSHRCPALLRARAAPASIGSHQMLCLRRLLQLKT